MSSEVAQIVDGGLKVSVPISVSAASFLGLHIEDWMYIFTIGYTVLQSAYLVYRWRRSYKINKEKSDGESDD